MNKIYKWILWVAYVIALASIIYILFAPKAAADRYKQEGFEYVGRAGSCDVYTKFAAGTRIFVTSGYNISCSVAAD